MLMKGFLLDYLIHKDDLHAPYLYVDTFCCNGVLRGCNGECTSPLRSVPALRDGVIFKLDICHICQRIVRTLPAEHPRKQSTNHSAQRHTSNLNILWTLECLPFLTI